MNEPIEKDAIRALIPHSGSMCLLDRVETWNDDALVCSSRSHRAPDNPLRQAGRLAALHAFEYAAQAAAVHGALLRGGRDAGPRVFAALRAARLGRSFLDDIESPLEITVTRLWADGDNAVYATEVRAGGVPVAAARLGLMAARPVTA